MVTLQTGGSYFGIPSKTIESNNPKCSTPVPQLLLVFRLQLGKVPTAALPMAPSFRLCHSGRRGRSSGSLGTWFTCSPNGSAQVGPPLVVPASTPPVDQNLICKPLGPRGRQPAKVALGRAISYPILHYFLKMHFYVLE